MREKKMLSNRICVNRMWVKAERDGNKKHCIKLMENNPFFVVAGAGKKYDDED
jgi:hypothetical protein